MTGQTHDFIKPMCNLRQISLKCKIHGFPCNYPRPLVDMHRKHQKQTKKRIHDMYQGPNIDISVILLIN
jgi:hypothetical protein